MKHCLLKTSNRLIAFLLSIIGIGTACSTACEYGSPAEEYGTPHADFKVLGDVRDAANDQKIKGIRVVMSYDTAYSDENGNYLVVNTSFPGTKVLQVFFEDVDGELNGSYQTLDTTIAFENPVFIGGDGNWYQGSVEKILNVKLTAE